MGCYPFYCSPEKEGKHLKKDRKEAVQFLYLKYFGRRLRLSKQALFQTLPRKTTFSYNFKSVANSILPGHFILPKSAFCPSLIPETPLKCVAQKLFLYQVEAELYDAHPNKWCFQVNKTAEKSSREAEERTCHLRARRKKYGNLQRGSVPALGARGTGLGGFPAPRSLFIPAPHPPALRALRADTGPRQVLTQGDDFSAIQPLAQVTARLSGVSSSRTARRTQCQLQGRRCHPRSAESARPQRCPLSARRWQGWQDGRWSGVHGGSPGAGCCES